MTLFVAEGVAGTWRYHLARTPYATRALCGAETMPTHLPIGSWGVVTHLKERYCGTCEQMAKRPEQAGTEIA